MNTFLMIFLSVVICVVWFYAVLKLAKHTVGKNAKFWQIMMFLLLAGPLGWASIAIIFVYDIVDTVITKLLKK